MTGTKIISVSLAELNQDKRKKLEKLASEKGYTLEAVVDRAFFADRLRQNGEWREKLLGLPGGPFSLSKYSIRGDIKARNFDLIGRADELEDINNSPDDLLLYGVPGVGKSALLESVPGLYFVDGNPSVERLMDDILATQPGILVIDDTLRRTDALENLQLIRRQESLAFRIVAVCWPHQLEELKVHIPAAAEMQILPLIRQDIGAVVRNAGISRESIIARILDQAQGRPAWAARLTDLLKDDVEWRQVHTGEAIRGEVSQYLTRSGLSKEAKDVLAAIAVLGSLAESEISTLAGQLGVARLTVVHLIDDLAVGGLLDVRQQWTQHGSQENVYGVAPQILATSIVIDAFFGSGPAMLPVAELFESWPAKRTSIAVHCISAALLGEQGAYPLARFFFNALVEQGAIGVDSDVYRYYLHLGAEETQEILQRSIGEFSEIAPNESDYQRKATLERLAIFVADAIRDTHNVAVVGSFLDFAAAIDKPPLVQLFLSNIINGIRNAHIPDGSINLGPLFRIWDAAVAWFAASSSSHKTDTLTMLVNELLRPAFEANSLSPEDNRLLRLISVVLPPESMRQFRDKVWTSFISLVTEPGHDELSALTSLFKPWVQIARGFNPVFGKEISADQISEAKIVAADMADYIIAHSDDFPGLRASVRKHSDAIDREFPEPDPLVAAVFFVSEEEDWHERRERFENTLREQVRQGMTQPLEFFSRLAALRPHMNDWDQPLTNPLHTIFRLVADVDTDFLPLLLFAKDNGMFPEAGPLVAPTLNQSDIDETALSALLDDGDTRPHVVQYVLTTALAERYLGQIADQLTPEDVANVVVPAPVADRLLRHTDSGVRASAAATILVSTDGELGSNLPGDTVALVVDALKDLTLPIPIHGRDSTYFFDRLIACAPDIYEHLLAKAITTTPGENLHKALRPFEHTAPMLTADAKTRLLVKCEPGTRERNHVLAVLRGNDTDWLESLLDADLINTDQVESTFNRPGAPAPIEALARILVPRGADPLTIAAKVELGTHWGEDHERLEGYVDRMRGLAQSSEPPIAAVGKAGLEHYLPRVEAARLRFRESQVRGR
ncbi:hypothetical protein MU0083_001749 [[Mycobacterium] kokjensenii]|uniref:ATP-binding protein n=1 Tax=[Mycobacterium] kokjensenii TaxID=3064287 RepID=A0ABN9MZ41_9MYCO|nr:hypothetical protein [Mycolicibacter sp. MU0083]CAJ1497729.1 hypothetical protein MU0083_001749 [Mycolicibacter sp. MU0083]